MISQFSAIISCMEEDIIDRPGYIDRIMPFVDTDVVKVLVGLRRSGKSQLLELIQRRLIADGRSTEQIISLNFEDFSLMPLRNSEDLYSYLVKRVEAVDGKAYVFLDEVQEVSKFEQVINSLRAVQHADVYITGSNSRLLSSELATILAGRYVLFQVNPFGYREFRDARALTGADQSFEAFLSIGGMPYLATKNLDQTSAQTYLTDIYNSVILKDVVQRYEIRDVTLLERIVLFAMQNIGNPLSANAVAKYLKSEHLSISTQTVLNYLEYCCDAFLFQRIRRIDLKGKEMLRSPQKLFVADHGLRAAVIGNGMSDIQGILENIVACEAIRRGYQLFVGSIDSREVDFVLSRAGARRYIQVCYLLADQATVKREFGAFAGIADNYPKTVVSMDPVLRPQSGIEHRRIDEFLLAEDW